MGCVTGQHNNIMCWHQIQTSSLLSQLIIDFNHLKYSTLVYRVECKVSAWNGGQSAIKRVLTARNHCCGKLAQVYLKHVRGWLLPTADCMSKGCVLGTHSLVAIIIVIAVPPVYPSSNNTWHNTLGHHRKNSEQEQNSQASLLWLLVHDLYTLCECCTGTNSYR